MSNHSPIPSPSPELIEQWMQAHSTKYDLARHAAQWGADQELEACLRYAGDNGLSLSRMRAARRPKPPSWKEQALARCNDYIDPDGIIRRALEALDD